MQRIKAQAEAAQNSNDSRRKYLTEIGKWKSDVTDLSTFLCNFETSATALKVTGEMKALELTRCLVTESQLHTCRNFEQFT